MKAVVVTSAKSIKPRKREAKRDDENYFYVGCWEYMGDDKVAPELTKEPLEYEAIKVQTRNYKN